MASRSIAATEFGEVSADEATLQIETSGWKWHKEWAVVDSVPGQNTHPAAAGNIGC